MFVSRVKKNFFFLWPTNRLNEVQPQTPRVKRATRAHTGPGEHGAGGRARGRRGRRSADIQARGPGGAATAPTALALHRHARLRQRCVPHCQEPRRGAAPRERQAASALNCTPQACLRWAARTVPPACAPVTLGRRDLPGCVPRAPARLPRGGFFALLQVLDTMAGRGRGSASRRRA